MSDGVTESELPNANRDRATQSLPHFSVPFLSPFLPFLTFVPDRASSENEPVMGYSHRPLHTPPPPLRFVLKSNSADTGISRRSTDTGITSRRSDIHHSIKSNQ